MRSPTLKHRSCTACSLKATNQPRAQRHYLALSCDFCETSAFGTCDALIHARMIYMPCFDKRAVWLTAECLCAAHHASTTRAAACTAPPWTHYSSAASATGCPPCAAPSAASPSGAASLQALSEPGQYFPCNLANFAVADVRCELCSRASKLHVGSNWKGQAISVTFIAHKHLCTWQSANMQGCKHIYLIKGILALQAPITLRPPGPITLKAPGGPRPQGRGGRSGRGGGGGRGRSDGQSGRADGRGRGDGQAKPSPGRPDDSKDGQPASKRPRVMGPGAKGGLSSSTGLGR